MTTKRTPRPSLADALAALGAEADRLDREEAAAEEADRTAALLASRDAAYLAQRDALRAFRNRDDVGSAGWLAAHRECKALDRAAAEAQQAVFDAGIEHAPYWWVKPGAYERGLAQLAGGAA